MQNAGASAATEICKQIWQQRDGISPSDYHCQAVRESPLGCHQDMLVLVQRLYSSWPIIWCRILIGDEDPSKTPGCVSTTLIQTYCSRPISSSVFVEVRLRTGRWRQPTLFFLFIRHQSAETTSVRTSRENWTVDRHARHQFQNGRLMRWVVQHSHWCVLSRKVTEGLEASTRQTKDNVAADSGVRPSACEYQSFHHLTTSSRQLNVTETATLQSGAGAWWWWGGGAAFSGNQIRHREN